MALRKIEFEDITKLLNDVTKKFPISVSTLEPILERIYEQYPLVSRVQIALVMRGFFVVLRKMVLRGQSVSFGLLLKRFSFWVGQKIDDGRTTEQIRVRLRTPPKMRNEYGRK